MNKKFEKFIFTALRLSLAIVFIWFGLLKVFGFNPVFDLIHQSMMPMLASGNGLIALGVFETIIGLMLLVNKFIKATHIVLFLHLLGTFSTFIFGWNVIFNPGFPILTLEGEFVVKNIVLVMAGLAVLSYEAKKM